MTQDVLSLDDLLGLDKYELCKRLIVLARQDMRIHSRSNSHVYCFQCILCTLRMLRTLLKITLAVLAKNKCPRSTASSTS